ncbi:hypothetical protein ACFL6S_01520, partial [Candidatus Poribacteria bacterium]
MNKGIAKLTWICICLLFFTGCELFGGGKKPPPSKISREEMPPEVVLRVDDHEATGTDKLTLDWDMERMQEEDLFFISEKGQTVKLWGSGAVVVPGELFQRWQKLDIPKQPMEDREEADARIYPLRLHYEQVFGPAGRRIKFVLLPVVEFLVL